jgi:hypothetical protein
MEIILYFIFYVQLVYVFYGHLAYFTAMRYIFLLLFGIFFPVLVCCRKNNLATLTQSGRNISIYFQRL